MCQAVEELAEKRAKTAVELAEKRAEERRINSLVENVKNLMETTKWTVEQALNALKVSEADQSAIMKNSSTTQILSKTGEKEL